LEHRNNRTKPERQCDSLWHIIQLPVRRGSTAAGCKCDGRLLQDRLAHDGWSPGACVERNTNSDAYRESDADANGNCNRNSNFNSDTDAHTNGHGHCDGDSYSYSYSNCHCHANSNRDSYSNSDGRGDTYTDLYSKTYTDTKVHPGTKASPDSTAAPVEIFARRKFLVIDDQLSMTSGSVTRSMLNIQRSTLDAQ
jgi:hypothetical protein